jgi:hypothetical protein
MRGAPDAQSTSPLEMLAAKHPVRHRLPAKGSIDSLGLFIYYENATAAGSGKSSMAFISLFCPDPVSQVRDSVQYSSPLQRGCLAGTWAIACNWALSVFADTHGSR